MAVCRKLAVCREGKWPFPILCAGSSLKTVSSKHPLSTELLSQGNFALWWWFLFVTSLGSTKKSFSAILQKNSWNRFPGKMTRPISDGWGWLLESSIPWNVRIPGSCTGLDFQIESGDRHFPQGDLPFKLQSDRRQMIPILTRGAQGEILHFTAEPNLTMRQGRIGKRLS